MSGFAHTVLQTVQRPAVERYKEELKSFDIYSLTITLDTLLLLYM